MSNMERADSDTPAEESSKYIESIERDEYAAQKRSSARLAASGSLQVEPHLFKTGAAGTCPSTPNSLGACSSMGPIEENLTLELPPTPRSRSVSFQQHYSCPYHKRKPRVFNCCDYQTCATTSFPNMLTLKRHIMEAHRLINFDSQCTVCKSWFRGEEALKNHSETRICSSWPSSTADSYDRGITDAMENTLRDHRQVSTWEAVWRTIFPTSTTVLPSNFVPSLKCHSLGHQTHDATLIGMNESTQTCAEAMVPSILISHDRGRTDSRSSSRSRSRSESRRRHRVISDRQASPFVASSVTASTTGTTGSSTSSSLRQVGVARVHIELLSLSDEYKGWARHHDESPEESSDGTATHEYQEGGSNPEPRYSRSSAEAGSTTTTTSFGNVSEVPALFASGEQLVFPHKRSQRDDGEDDSDDDGNRPRKKPRRKPPSAATARRRFACPYQVFEPWRHCLKPSGKNRNGGCDGISRLKDHLARKHMSSSRCERCWKWFSSGNKIQEHRRKECFEMERPEYERFMTSEQETLVKKCGGTQPEEAWWSLFQLLIPGMQQEDLPELQTRYFPYYIDMSLTIPSITLPNISFAPTASEAHQAAWAIPSSDFSGPENTSLTSQSFFVPVYGASAQQAAPAAGQDFGSESPALILPSEQQPFEPVSTTPSSGNTSSMTGSYTPPSTLNATPRPTGDVSQMRRNYDRLKMRAIQTDSQNAELRETISTTREELGTIRGLLDDVLDTCSLEDEAYQRLSNAAEMLVGLTGRLR
ncbi:hypothetical protein ACJZ2D_005806 [Fusarium nematophilum]